MKSKIILAAAGMLISASLLAALPALAQTTTAGKLKPSLPARENVLQAKAASNTANRMANLQNRGDQAVDVRVTSLNDLLGRIQEMKKVPEPMKTSFADAIQSEINALTNLKAKMASDTSTTTLKADEQSITKAYRVYALIMPRINISAAADRISTTADMLTTISGKLQVRLASTTGSADTASLQADLTDMNAKIADAKTQAAAAVSGIASLQPDNGVQATMQSNTAALKDARDKIQTAQKDLVTARQDAQTITNALRKPGTSPKATASSTNQ